MKTYDPVGFGERLTEEVTRAGLSLRDLEQEVEARIPPGVGRRGISRGNLSTWIRGLGPQAGEPRRNVVEALALVFSSPGSTVRPEYLLYGDGWRTEEEEKLEALEAEARGQTEPSWYEVLHERIPSLARLPYRFTVALLDHAALLATQEHRRAGRPSRPVSEQEETVLRYAEDVWREVARPLARCRSLGDYAVFDYLEAAIHARNLALRIPVYEGIEDLSELTTEGEA